MTQDEHLNEIIAKIGKRNSELSEVLMDLRKEMSIYKFKLVITYVSSYFEEFVNLYDKNQTLRKEKSQKLYDEFDPIIQEIKSKDY
mmetsp:Transcript_17606/g.16833  ORF Transcript_17606/g.16833 Transcript_17606/m.16833 type:complete len:86 (+) Transcript_17606:1248-1505(+)